MISRSFHAAFRGRWPCRRAASPKGPPPHPESDGRDQRYGFRATTTTLSAPNVFVMRFVLSEEDFAK